MTTLQFWTSILAFGLVLFASVFLTLRMHEHVGSNRKSANMGLREMQLAEVDSELNSGLINEDTASAMRLEVERAFTRANRRAEETSTSQGPKWGVWAIIAACFGVAIWIYTQIGLPNMPDFPYANQAELRRPPQERAYAILKDNGGLAPLPEVDSETAGLIAQLEETLKTHADEAEGWKFLARSSYTTGNYRRAYEAQEQYIALKETDATAEDYTLLAESMILSVNGYVSPEAENALRQALILDPKNRVGRYYAGLTMIQNGEVDDGRALLEMLLAENLDDPNWSAEIQKRLEETQPAKGPSAEDMKNAANMSEDERQQMIGGMVDGLKARLAESGGTPDEWAQLIKALRVLGREDEANAILGEAKQKFPNDPNIQAIE